MPLIDFKVVKEGLGECDCLLIVQALVRKRLYTSIGNEPTILILTEDSLYWGGTEFQKKQFNRIPLKSIMDGGRCGWFMFETVKITHMEIYGEETHYFTPFIGSKDLPIKDRPALDLLSKIIQRQLLKMRKQTINTAFGNVTLEYSKDGLCKLSFTDEHPEDSETVLAKKLRDYFMGEKTDFKHIQLDFGFGTDFQKMVWNEARNIPYGETTTYTEIAKELDISHSARAIGNALNKNPIPIIVPCHRVVAKNGLGGYAFGLDFKKKLLELEGSI